MSPRIPLPRFADPLRLPPALPFAATEPDEPLGPAELLRLVRRIAAEDRAAFADLYDALSARILCELESTNDPVRAAAITSATFVEVWALARFHIGSDTDVHAWLTDIVARRSADRRTACTDHGSQNQPAGPTPWWAAAADSNDRELDLALRDLLVRPSVVAG
jgi:hypothetical protein